MGRSAAYTRRMGSGFLWFGSCVDILAAIGIIAVAFLKVRPAAASGAYVLAGAGAVRLLGSCCIRGFTSYLSSAGGGGSESLMRVPMLVGTMSNVLFALLVAVGFALIAKAAKTTPHGREA